MMNGAAVQGMKTSTHWVGANRDIILLTVIGYVDTTTCKDLARQIREFMDENHLQIVVDLGGVSYISSAGWGVFVGEIKNIRERGGDLKIVQMTAEVIEVFEMLEFNRILNHYETIEEAIDEFDIIRGIDITRAEPAPQGAAPVERAERYPAPVRSGGERGGRKSAGPSPIAPSEFPLVEKIKRIAIDNPMGGTRSIQRALNTETYGFSRVGWFRIRKLLKELNLETKDKRYRYYRSR